MILTVRKTATIARISAVNTHTASPRERRPKASP